MQQWLSLYVSYIDYKTTLGVYIQVYEIIDRLFKIDGPIEAQALKHTHKMGTLSHQTLLFN